MVVVAEGPRLMRHIARYGGKNTPLAFIAKTRFCRKTIIRNTPRVLSKLQAASATTPERDHRTRPQNVLQRLWQLPNATSSNIRTRPHPSRTARVPECRRHPGVPTTGLGVCPGTVNTVFHHSHQTAHLEPRDPRNIHLYPRPLPQEHP